MDGELETKARHSKLIKSSVSFESYQVLYEQRSAHFVLLNSQLLLYGVLLLSLLKVKPLRRFPEISREPCKDDYFKLMAFNLRSGCLLRKLPMAPHMH